MNEAEKRELARTVGADLARHHGKKPHYSRDEVRTSVERCGYSVDVVCWAYCLFLTHGEFDAFHASIGEVCDYLAMKGSMVAAVTEHASDSWLNLDLDLSWFEWPDFDVGSFLDW